MALPTTLLTFLGLLVLSECIYIQPDEYCNSLDVVYLNDAEGTITSNWHGTYLPDADCVWVIRVPYPLVTFDLVGFTVIGEYVVVSPANITDFAWWLDIPNKFSISLDFAYHGYFRTDERHVFTVFFYASGGQADGWKLHWVSMKEEDALRSPSYHPLLNATDGNDPNNLIDGIYSCIATNQSHGWFSSSPEEHSILVDFQEPILAAWYSVTSEGGCVLPGSFWFWGSRDNVQWDILDMCNASYVISDFWDTNFAKVIYRVEPSMQYRYYRLTVPAGDQTIGELEIASRNDTLLAGQILYQNSNISSLSGQYAGILLPNGTFVVYDTINNSCIWSLVTPGGMKRSGVASYMLTMMLNGDLAIFSSDTLIWNIGINTTDTTKTVLLNNGTLHVYSINSGASLWGSELIPRVHTGPVVNNTNSTNSPSPSPGTAPANPTINPNPNPNPTNKTINNTIVNGTNTTNTTLEETIYIHDNSGAIIGGVVGSVLGLVIVGLVYYMASNTSRTAPNQVILVLPEEIRSHYDDYTKHPNKWTGDASETVFTKELKPGSTSYEKLLKHLKIMQGDFINIKSAFAVHNYNLLYSFAAKHHNITTQVNENEAVFWKKQWVTDELGLRDWTCQMYKDLCDKFEWNSVIKVPIIMTIHGTDERFATSIIKTGFVALGKLDDGYFGKGMYFTSSVRYALPYFGNKTKPAILVSLTITGNPYPVIEHPFKSEKSFNGVALVRGHHSHYVLTRANGYPCTAVLNREKDPFYDEIVIEQESSILPFYVINISQTGLMEVVAEYQKEVSNIKKAEQGGAVDERPNLGRFEDAIQPVEE